MRILLFIFIVCSSLPIAAYDTASHKIKISVIDSGFDLDHPCLVGQDITILSEQNEGYLEHGTAVLSVLAGNMPYQGLFPHGQYYCFDVGDYWFNTMLINQSLRASIDLKVNIINMSFNVVENYATNLLLQEACEKGIILVAAAGNHTVALQYPAKSPYVLSAGDLAEWSALDADYITDTALISAALAETEKVEWFNGTSFSCPVVVGRIAQLLEKGLDYKSLPKHVEYSRDLIEYFSKTDRIVFRGNKGVKIKGNLLNTKSIKYPCYLSMDYYFTIIDTPSKGVYGKYENELVKVRINRKGKYRAVLKESNLIKYSNSRHRSNCVFYEKRHP